MQRTSKNNFAGQSILNAHLSPIDILETDNIQKVIKSQFSMLSLKKTEIKNDVLELDFNTLSFDNSTHLLKIKKGVTIYNTLFIRNGNSDSLFVILSGARSVNESPTLFKRWSYYPFVDQNVILFSDPGLEKYAKKGLLLNWYLGEKKVNILKDISDIVKKIATLLNIDQQKITFFGSSGGGFAALQISKFFEGTYHFAINPQIYIKNWPYYPILKKIKEADDCDITSQIEEMDNLIKQTKNKFFICQNLSDEEDYKKQLFPLLKKLNIDKIEIGLNGFDYLLFWFYFCSGGHNSQGDQILFSFLLNWGYRYFTQQRIGLYDDFNSKALCIMFNNLITYSDLAKKK